MEATEADTTPDFDTTCIGFIGLGMMGLPTAKHLIEKGYKVAVYDIYTEKVVELESFGAIATNSALEIANISTCIFSMLPGPKEVKSLYLGEEGIMANLKHKGTYILECSTIGPHAVEELNSTSKKSGHIFLDCPISGGIQGATQGTLTFMVGGSDSHYNCVEPLLKKIGKTIIHTGPTGSAQAIKLSNNLSFAVNMMATIETYKLAAQLGADINKMTEVLNTSTGRSFVSQLYNPCPDLIPNCPSNNNYEGGYSLTLLLKDLKLAQSAAKECSLSLPTLDKVTELYEKAFDKGLGNLDFSAYFKLN